MCGLGKPEIILTFFKKIGKTPFETKYASYTFVLVFHRILDFKAGLDFYLGPLFLPIREVTGSSPIQVSALPPTDFIKCKANFFATAMVCLMLVTRSSKLAAIIQLN